MKRFILRLSIFLVLLAASVVLLHVGFFSTALNQNYLLKYKISLLKDAREEKNKIIIVGGSNASFAFHSADIENRTDREVVNASVNIHEGLWLYLNLVDPYLKSGDVLILSPEFGNLDGKTFFGTEKQVLNAHTFPQFYRTLASEPAAAANFVSNTSWHVEYFLGFLFHLKFLRDRAEFERSVRSHYDENGDWSDFDSQPSKANFSIVVQEPLDRNKQLFQKRINDFCERGIRCFWTYPPVKNSSLSLKYQLTDYHQQVQNFDGLTVLLSPSDSIYDDNSFFDSPYHLNQQTGAIHTNKILDALEPQL